MVGGSSGKSGTGGTQVYEFDEYNPVSTIKYSVVGSGTANTGGSSKNGVTSSKSGQDGIVIIRNNRTKQETVPITFTYTGNYEIVNDDDTPYTAGNKNWKIKLLTSGEFKFTSTKDFTGNIDAFLVGGGASGGAGWYDSVHTETGGSGGPGYNETYLGINLETGTTYNVVVGSGGTAPIEFSEDGKDGGSTSAFGKTVSGGTKGEGGVWGYSGSNGSGGTQVYAFNDQNMGKTRYSVVGGGNRNTGNSGSSSSEKGGNAGGSGIVIIRNKR